MSLSIHGTSILFECCLLLLGLNTDLWFISVHSKFIFKMKKLVLLIGAISNTEAHRENYRNTERYGTYQSSYYGNHRDQNHNNRDNNRNRYDVNQFDRQRSSWSNGFYNRPGKEFSVSLSFYADKLVNNIREILTRNVQWIWVPVMLWKINEKIS